MTIIVVFANSNGLPCTGSPCLQDDVTVVPSDETMGNSNEKVQQ